LRVVPAFPTSAPTGGPSSLSGLARPRQTLCASSAANTRFGFDTATSQRRRTNFPTIDPTPTWIPGVSRQNVHRWLFTRKTLSTPNRPPRITALGHCVSVDLSGRAEPPIGEPAGRTSYWLLDVFPALIVTAGENGTRSRCSWSKPRQAVRSPDSQTTLTLLNELCKTARPAACEFFPRCAISYMRAPPHAVSHRQGRRVVTELPLRRKPELPGHPDRGDC